MATVTVTGRHDLSDAQWAELEAVAAQRARPGRPPRWSRRQLIDGIRWRVRVGGPWRDVPQRYGSWSAAYGLFSRWQRDGTWAKLLTTLQAIADAAGRIVWELSVDSTTARAHQHAATVMVPAAAITMIGSDRSVHIGCTRQQIRDAPRIRPSVAATRPTSPHLLTTISPSAPV